jgi:hypothetical protein
LGQGLQFTAATSLRRAAQHWPELFQKNESLFDGHQGSGYCRRMRVERFLNKSIVVRELLPQDL